MQTIIDGDYKITTTDSGAVIRELNRPAPAPVADQRITPFHFKKRLTPAERIAIRDLAKVNSEVYDYMDMLDTAPVVHLDDPMTRGGLQMLEAAGKLATGRAAAVLDAPVQENERP